LSADPTSPSSRLACHIRFAYDSTTADSASRRSPRSGSCSGHLLTADSAAAARRAYARDTLRV